jgi:hypothetical protein
MKTLLTVKVILISYMCLLTSCSSNKSIFRDEALNSFDTFHLKKAIEFEKGAHAKDITRTYLVTIGEGIYPNYEKFVLAKPKTFKRKQEEFEIKTEYYYTLPDSLVRVVLYEWNEPMIRKSKEYSPPIVKSNLSELKKYDKFQSKFDEIIQQLTKVMGEPNESEIGHAKNENTSFRDGLKWKTDKGLHAYLLMFGNNSQSYRQIRLAIYSK